MNINYINRGWGEIPASMRHVRADGTRCVLAWVDGVGTCLVPWGIPAPTSAPTVGIVVRAVHDSQWCDASTGDPVSADVVDGACQDPTGRFDVAPCSDCGSTSRPFHTDAAAQRGEPVCTVCADGGAFAS